jgi:electron transport complex protein RnfC
MKLFSFRGGVHPPEMKELAENSPITKAEVPSTLTVPLVQHIGAPCKATVEAGQSVQEGQVIGETQAFVTAPVHAPVCGKVKKIENVLHPLGVKLPAVILAVGDGDDRDYLKPLGGDVETLDATQMLERVKEAGIVGMGGATFPAHVKFSPPKDKTIDTFILNGCECEPYLTADYRLMVERSEDVLLGTRMIAKILGVKRTIIGIEENKPQAIESLRTRAAAAGNGDEVQVTQTKYPQGAEKMLIKAVLNREVPSGGLPMDVGVVVSNVGTALAVCEAVRDGKPLIDRVVTVTGDGVKHPGNYLARIGTSVQNLVDQAGGTVGTIGKLIAGGPMMGLAQASLDIPVIKGTSGILILQEQKQMHETHLPCIKCSFCVQACPVHLIPSRLSIIAEAQNWKKAEEFGVNDCIECGCCTYVCPSRRPIVQFIKTTKMKLRKLKATEK